MSHTNTKKGNKIELSSLEQEVIEKCQSNQSLLGKLIEVREYNNGSIGAFYSNGQHRFISGASRNKNKVIDKNSRKYKVSEPRWTNRPSDSNIKKKLRQKNQSGGNSKPVSLKTAVKLLREYYSEKYN